MQATIPPTHTGNTGFTQQGTGLLGTPTGELVLQICGGEHDGRALRLTAAKCTIGSAPGCTLRLRARGIRPVHALILRGPQGALIRCWSPDTQLNERGFSEAVLELGDKIQIGPITLSIAELARSMPRPRALAAPSETEHASRKPRRVNRRRRKQLFSFLRQERQQQTNLQQALEAQRAQLNTYEQQVEQLKAAAAEASSRPAATESLATADCLSQQLAKTIEQLRNELDAAAKRRTMEQQTFARQHAAYEQQAEQRLQAEVAQLREELTAQQLAQTASIINEKLAEMEQQVAAKEMQRLSLAREIESLKLALDTKTKSEELGRQSAASQIEQLSQAYELVRQERDELFDRLHAEQQTFDGQSHNWQAQIAEIQTAAQMQISQLRAEFAKREQHFDEELIARTSSEGLRSAADAERIHNLSVELETLRNEFKASAKGSVQQQEGFTLARKRLEAEIASLNARLQQSEQAVHEARENSGQLQAAVLAEAEQARAQRNAVREQMLRQQQDWTEFRSRLELAANEERELARLRAEGLEAELKTCTQQRDAAKAECETLQDRLTKLEIEIEQAQESLLAAEHGANQRLQQMTISMENLQLERSNAPSQAEQERAEWERERNSLAQCVAELQQQVTQLTDELHSVQQQAADDDAEKLASADAQLQSVQGQLAQWQATAEEARQQAAELNQAVAKFRQQEQIWQIEREQLDHQQQTANARLHQLESSITELQQQLNDAQHAVAVTCPQGVPPVQPAYTPPGQADFGGTININNQDLAALCEQANEAAPSLLAPRNIDALDPHQLSAFQAREAALQEQAEALAEQQAQLEEEQAIVARQRIELEQFQASLLELEHSLTQRAEELLHPPALPDPNASNVAADFHDHSFGGEPERESNPLSESEAFAAMADQVAALYTPAAEKESIVHEPEELAEFSYDSPATFSPPEDLVEANIQEQLLAAMEQAAAVPYSQSNIIGIAADNVIAEDVVENATPLVGEESSVNEPVGECLVISSSASDDSLNNDSPAEPQFAAGAISNDPTSGVIEPTNDDDFDRQLEARIARVMRRERTDWSTPAAEETPEPPANGNEAAAETPPTTQSQAVNSVLDRLKEAGLWKGEGTAKADQMPSSNPPIDEAGAGLCRSSQVGPIGSEIAGETVEVEAHAAPEPEEDNLSMLARPSAAKPSLLSTPAKDDDADDSIESYMSRLMQRLKGPSADEEPSPRKTNSSSRTTNSHPAKSADSAPPPPPKVTDSRPLTSLSELSPRSQAPELSSNLAAMRELANSAARGAIETHRTRNKQQSVNMRTVNTLMAVLVAAGFTYMWSRTGSFLALGGISLSLLWAIGSSLLAATQSLTLRKASRNAADSEQAADEAPPQQ